MIRRGRVDDDADDEDTIIIAIRPAAIGLQGPSIRLTPTRLDEFAPIVQDAASDVASLVIRY